jgi:phage terminase small subunit
VAEYLIDLNATQAAIRAGYSRKSAEIQGHDNLRNPRIATAVAVGKAKQLEKAELTAERTLEEVRRIAFFDMSELFDPDSGKLKPVSALSPEARSALASIEVARTDLAVGGEQQWTCKVKVRTSSGRSSCSVSISGSSKRTSRSPGTGTSWRQPWRVPGRG